MSNPIRDQMIAALQNPEQFCRANGLPPDAFQNPQAAVQAMMQSGRCTQMQYNEIAMTMQQMQQDQEAMQQMRGDNAFMQLFARFIGR